MRERMTARIERARVWMRQAWCGATGGHDRLLHFGHDRLALRCVSCDSETPGWVLTAEPLTATAAANALQRDDLIWSSVRRIA